MQKLDKAYSEGNESKIADLERQLMIEGGFLLVSLIPASKIGRSAKVLNVKPQAIQKIKAKPSGSSSKRTNEQAQRLLNEINYQKSLDSAGYKGVPDTRSPAKIDSDFQDIMDSIESGPLYRGKPQVDEISEIDFEEILNAIERGPLKR